MRNSAFIRCWCTYFCISDESRRYHTISRWKLILMQHLPDIEHLFTDPLQSEDQGLIEPITCAEVGISTSSHISVVVVGTIWSHSQWHLVDFQDNLISIRLTKCVLWVELLIDMPDKFKNFQRLVRIWSIISSHSTNLTATHIPRKSKKQHDPCTPDEKETKILDDKIR